MKTLNRLLRVAPKETFDDGRKIQSPSLRMRPHSRVQVITTHLPDCSVPRQTADCSYQGVAGVVLDHQHVGTVEPNM